MERASRRTRIDNHSFGRSLRPTRGSEKRQLEPNAEGEMGQSHRVPLFQILPGILYGKISSFASEPLAESGLIQTVTLAGSTAN
jgi:hypothetical protein